MGASNNDVVARSKARIGKVLRKRWTLDELLGLGGMAAVYAATHRNGKRVAIKVLQPEAAAIADVRARFLREGYLANRVGHPGAVSILDDDIDEDGTVFLVMELLEGESLDTRWHHHGKLPYKEVLLIADQVLAVLQAAHAKGIIHRDLKPGNIFVERSGGVKVLDFGIARLERMDLRPGDTGYGTALGTPGFMPPEQARGRWDQIDSRSDLFALGATMYALLSNRHVHEADTANEQFVLAMTAQANSLESVAAEVPEQVRAIVDRALRYERDERWSHATAMREAIQQVYQELCGEPMGSGSQLSLPVIGNLVAVNSDAPTLGLEDLDASARSRMSTTRPVTDGSSGGASRPRWGRRALVAAASVAALATAVFFATGPSTSTPRTPSAEPAASPPQPTLASTATAAAESSVATAPSATVEPGSEPSADAAAERAPSAKLVKAPVVAPRPVRGPPPAEPPPPKPSASAEPIDIFSRRK
jgi:serine/threonine-protein kinase